MVWKTDAQRLKFSIIALKKDQNHYNWHVLRSDRAPYQKHYKITTMLFNNLRGAPWHDSNLNKSGMFPL